MSKETLQVRTEYRPPSQYCQGLDMAGPNSPQGEFQLLMIITVSWKQFQAKSSNEAVEKPAFESREVPSEVNFGAAAPFLSLTPTSGLYNAP